MNSDTGLLRADLHVHSYHSGYATHFRFLRTRDCYSDPEAVYARAKARGMDLVTITDHDSIGGCLEFLERHPEADDFFISEEIECRFPDVALRIHVGAYGITERIHAEARRLRGNVYDLTVYLREQGVPFALNHMFFFFQRQIPLEQYLRAVLGVFPAFEARNGAMLREHNTLIEEILQARVDAGTAGLFAGSDAHTLRRVGTTYTEAAGRTREEFLGSLRAGRTRIGGRHGTTLDIAIEIYGVIGRYWATLAGFGRPDLSWPRRGVGVAWSLASLPVEFVPLLVGVVQKKAEARNLARCRSDLAHRAPAAGVVAEPS
jgi:predicted metal-dependent phosphoesterase TrpH